MVGQKVLDACANAQGAGARADVLQAVQEARQSHPVRELPREGFLLERLLIGLEKPGGGVRPIAISETWYCFGGVCTLRTYGRGIGPRLASLQVGVGTPGSTETEAHALTSAVAEDAETVIISVDMANAFNSIHQAAMFAAVQ